MLNISNDKCISTLQEDALFLGTQDEDHRHGTDKTAGIQRAYCAHWESDHDSLIQAVWLCGEAV